MIRKSKFLPILVLSIIMIISVLSAFNLVIADTSFHKHGDGWDHLENTIEANSNEYPYTLPTQTLVTKQVDHNGNTIDGTTQYNTVISSVSSYITYGISKSLVVYYGEFPYNNIREGEDGNDPKFISGFSGYYSIEGTDSSTDTNPDFRGGNSVEAKTYWGTSTGTNFSNLKEAEDINKTDVVSLRLYANEHTMSSGIGSVISYWIRNLLYTIAKGIAWLATKFVTIVVEAKNICMSFILNALHLPDLADIINKAFVIDKNTRQISFFMAICICFLIFEIVAFAINYAKGGSKNKSISNIIITALIGFSLVGFALSGRIQDIGSSVSNLVSKVMYVASNSMQDSYDGTFFKYDVNDTDNESKTITMSELSLVYKPFMDIQIATQFGVDTIDELQFSKYGDPDCTVAAATLITNTDKNKSNLSAADFKTNFNNNLGYYFWFANSSATEKVNNNVSLPTTSASANENKLNSMITYLQKQYNSGDSTRKSLIKTNIEELSNPSPLSHFLSMLVLAAIIIILGLVLAKYAVNVIISKLCLFVALLGFGPAGIMVLSNKDKWVKTGKQIVQMVLISFIEITVWSVFFDLILYVVAFLLADDLMRLILVLALLLLFWKFNYTIAEVIKRSLDNATRAMCPEYHSARASAKNFMYKGKDKVREFNDKEIVVGQDENGENIYKKRGETAAGRFLTFGSNALLTNGNDHKTFYGLHKKEKEERSKYHTEQNKAKGETAKKSIDNIENRLSQTENSVNTAIKSSEDAARESYDANTNSYKINLDSTDKSYLAKEIRKLNESRSEAVDNLNDTKQKLDALMANNKDLESMSDENKQKYKELTEKYKVEKNNLDDLNSKLNDFITKYRLKQELHKITLKDETGKDTNICADEILGMSDEELLNTDAKTIRDIILAHDFNKVKDQYVHDLHTAKDAANETTQGRKRKIGKKKRNVVDANKEYIQKTTEIDYKLQAIENQGYIDNATKEKIAKDTKKVTENTIRSQYKLNVNNDASALKQKYLDADLFSEERAKYKEQYEEAVEKNNATNKQLKDTTKIAKAGGKAHKRLSWARKADTDDLRNFYMNHEEYNKSQEEAYKEIKDEDAYNNVIRNNEKSKIPWKKDTLKQATASGEAARALKEENDKKIDDAAEIIHSNTSSKEEKAIARAQRNIAKKDAKEIDKQEKRETNRQIKVTISDKKKQINNMKDLAKKSTNVEDRDHYEQAIEQTIKDIEDLRKGKGNLSTENQKIESSINDMELERFNPEMNDLLNKNLEDDLNYFEKLGKDTDSDDGSSDDSDE